MNGSMRMPAAAALALALGLFAVASSVPSAAAVPSFADVRGGFASSEAQLVDRRGSVLATMRADRNVRRLDWVALADISPAMISTLIAAEDKRFYEHAGVDWPGFASAAWDSIGRTVDGRGARGASTLSMQVAAMLDPALAIRGSARTLAQKWDQAQAALALERSWSKVQILEAYLNLAAYRGELSGIDAAAHGLFGKAPAGLDANEAAILVALQRGPNAPAATVAQRACAVAALASAPSTGSLVPSLACEDLRANTMIALAGGYRRAARDNAAPHLAARLLTTPGARVATTLDGELQRFAVRMLRDHLAELADRAVGDGAIVVLDNASGDVLAWVGSSGELSGSAQVDGVIAPRQAGSTLKPFLYAQAIDRHLLTAASLVDDSPVAIATERGAYVPQNYDRSFRGTVSVRTALASSLNVPAVRTVELVGIERFHDSLRALGFDTLTEAPEYYGASLALGGADVTLLALANAYRALANGGSWSPVQVTRGADAKALPASARRVFSAQAAFIVGDILSDRGARAASFGLENALATRVWSAVKTGTSKDMRDNWCVGYTPRYTVGVWVGNFSGAPMHDVSGVTGAAPIWRDLVHRLHASEARFYLSEVRFDPGEAPFHPSEARLYSSQARPHSSEARLHSNDASDPAPAPAGVVQRPLRFEPAVEPERAEWFIAGTEVAVVRGIEPSADAATAVLPVIRYPAPDTVIALDPDLPPARERVTFSASPAIGGLQWRLDDALIASDRGRADWRPTAGRHTLVLEDAQGRALSSVSFEVRGTR